MEEFKIIFIGIMFIIIIKFYKYIKKIETNENKNITLEYYEWKRIYFKMMVLHKFNELYKRVKVTFFVGRESNRIVAKHMSDYFIDTVERLADKEFEKVPGNRSEVNRMKHAFKQGCASRLSQRLRDKYAESNKPVEYTGIDNPNNLPLSYKNEEKALVKWLEDQGIKLVSKSSRFSVRDRVAFGRGSEKANDIGLNTQVNANARGYISN
jgi:hypothetical protein